MITPMSLQQSLLKWFHKNARPLPWRKHYRPYEVWVSEIMLQQTQMETVLPYFKRWMKAFPNIGSLAGSDEKKVLKLWQGLGYYSRARNLHESAKRIVRQHNGIFPENYETVLSLKGIGRYSAGAIASIAFNQEKPIVDGNVLRVLSRVYAIKKPIDVEKNKEIFWKLEESLIPKDQARYFNQAIMELGALVCHAENPLCHRCPISGFCAAFKQNNAENYPVRKNRKKMIKVEASAVVLSRSGKYLIQKRPLGKIMGGLWEFPEWKLVQNRKLPPGVLKKKTLSLAEKEFGAALPDFRRLDAIKRNYTHHNETLHVFSAALPNSENGFKTNRAWPHVWVSKKEFQKYPFSSAHAKIAKLLH